MTGILPIAKHSAGVSIPNHELMLKLEDVMSKFYIAKLTKRSKETLAATLRGDEEMVAGILMKPS